MGGDGPRLLAVTGNVLQGICAVGIAIGAVVAARFVPLNRAVNVVPVGIGMGLIVISMIFARNVVIAIPLMVVDRGAGRVSLSCR